MDKQPVGQLPDINQSSNDDELMIITNDETNELRKEKISDFITDLTSADEGNAIEKGADGKLFVSDTVNTSNIEGVLSLDNIPQLTTEKLPNSGVNAGFYRNPVNLNVNAKGQITSVEDGESGVINDITPFVTNTILSAQNQNITNDSVSDASYVNTGCTISEAGVASGFSADNRILLSKTMTSANAFTLEIPFTTGSNVTAEQTLVYINNFSNSLGISGGKIALHYDGNVLSGTTTLAANTAYVALLTRTASNYTVQVKTAAGAYDDAEITLASAVGYFAGKSIYVGGGDDSYFRGSIDLANLVIQENASNYWTYTTLSSFQTVTVSGTYQLLMPNGRNADKTMNNVTKTITLNDTLLYSPANGEKTVLVKEDGELMIRDYYAETYDQPADVPQNGVWMNKTANTLTEQLNTYPNFLTQGVLNVAADGTVTGFNANEYLYLPETYFLDNNSWELEFIIDISATVESTMVTTPDEYGDACKAFEVSNSGNQVTAQFRRDDVYIVNREITVSTAYEVQKTDSSGGEPVTVTGYVQTQGEAESYVTAGTQVYQDVAFETPLEQAAADTWTYTGDTYANTEIQTGYCKEGGVTLVPAETVVYSDANCTSVQGTASGTDYTYSGDRAESILCSCTTTVQGGYDNYKIGFNGSQYYLNDITYSSTDPVKDNITICFGDLIQGLKLASTKFTIAGKTAWQWNGVSTSTQDFVPFVGAKLGKVTDNGTTITAMELDMPLTLAKDTDVVHQTGNEEIYGVKKFNDWTVVKDANLTVMGTDKNPNYAPTLFVDYNATPNNTCWPQVSPRCIQTEVLTENLPASCTFGRICVTDKHGWIIGGLYVGTTGNVNQTKTVIQSRRNINGVTKMAEIVLFADLSGNPLCEFPKCTTRATTKSTAASNRVAVIVQNYVSGTSWYRVWSDGWIEQGARITLGNYFSITFPKAFTNTNYVIVSADEGANATGNLGITSRTKTGVTGDNNYEGNHTINYVAYGY